MPQARLSKMRKAGVRERIAKCRGGLKNFDGALRFITVSALGGNVRQVSGLVVKRGWQRGALLPRVAVEHRWDAEAFLRHTCLKAGLPPSAWRDADTELEVFEADEFGEGKEE